ncbi:MAG TPA: acyl-CoA dehydrogenase [Clostridia bacterium]|nr:acyl-CoA dehydrogenase [Clostridia bacterium]
MFYVELTPEHLALQEKVRAFIAEHVIPVAKEYDRTGEFPLPILREAAKAGLLNYAVPKEYGGPGLDALSVAVISEELGYGCVGIGMAMNGNTLSSYPVLIAGNDEQKRRWYQYLHEGKLVAFALTEPGAGSDAAAIETTAVPDGDEYVLNGSKCFCTTGGYASAMTVFASTDRSKGHRGLSAFIVEMDRPGVSVGKEEHKMGIRASNTVEILLRNVRIPKANLLGREGEGFKIAMQTLDSGRISVGAMAVGLARRALEATIDFVNKYQRGGKPLAKSQYYQFKIADLGTAVENARNLVYKACYLKEAGRPFTKEAAMAKTYATDMAMQVAAAAVEIMGPYGYMKDSPVEKLMRDVKVMQIYEGTNQIQRIVISRQLMG